MRLAARYQFERRLGPGGDPGAGDVAAFLVRDVLASRAPRVLKRLLVHANAGVAQWLVREFLLLSQLAFPTLAVPEDFGVAEADAEDPGGAFFVRPYVDGASFDEAFVVEGKIDVARVRTALAVAARTLAALHEAGFVHGDVRPANLLVPAASERDASVPPVVLVDAALAHGALGAAGRLRGGALAYLPPERRARLIAGEAPAPDRAADVYGLCATLRATLDRADDSQETELTELRALAAKGLEDDPSRRLVSARAFVAALGDEGAAWEPEPTVALRPEGREGELGVLLGAVARRLVRREGGAPATVLVGEEGSGRSTLLREVRWRAQLREVQVLCFDALAGEGTLARLRESVAVLTRGEEEPLVKVDALVGAVREAATTAPVLLLVDDVDHAGPDFVEALRALAYGAASGDALLIVASTTSDELAARIGPCEVVPVAELEASAVSALRAQWPAREIDEDEAARVLRPSQLRAALRGVKGEFSPGDGDDAVGVARAVLAVHRDGTGTTEALTALDGVRASHVARAGALGALRSAGQGAWRVGGHGWVEASRAIAGERGLEDARAYAKRVEASPDASAAEKVRAALAAGDSAAAARHAKRAAGECGARGEFLGAADLMQRTLETGYAPRAEALLVESIVRKNGGDFAGADRAATEAAGGFERGSPSWFSAALSRVRALRCAEAYDPAMRVVNDALDAVMDPFSRAELLASHAAVDLARGAPAMALESCAKASLAFAATRDPVDPVRVRATIELYTALAEEALGDGAKAVERLEAALSSVVGYGSGFYEGRLALVLAVRRARGGDLAQARAAYEQGERAARNAGDPALRACAALAEADLFALEGDLANARAAADRAERFALRARRPRRALEARVRSAELLLASGEHTRASAEADLLRPQAEALGSTLAAGRASLVGAEARLRSGDVEGALGWFRSARAHLDAANDPVRSLDARAGEAEALLLRNAAGDSDAAAVLLPSEADAPGDAPSAGNAPRDERLRLVRARLLLARGDGRGAQRTLQDAIESAETRQAWEPLALGLSLRARAHSLVGADVHARKDRVRAREVLEQAALRLAPEARVAFWSAPERAALRSSPAGSGERPVAPAPAAPAAKPSVAVESRAPSIAVTRPRAGSIAGGVSGISFAASSLSLALAGGVHDGRLALLLELSRRVGEEHTLERVLDQAVRSAVELTNAERGCALLVDARGELEVRARCGYSTGDGPDERFSRSIAEAVLIDGDPVATLNAQADARFSEFRSVHDLAIGAVAAVPVRARGRTLGVLYVENRLRRALWTGPDLALVRAFGEQAGVAVEHARLVEALELRGRELEIARGEVEHLLAERTEELELAKRSLAQAEAALRSRVAPAGMIGQSEPMRRVFAVVDRMRETDVPVVLEGESGTGKELVARAIHFNGGRGRGPFIVVHCGAIPETLLESELFGHVKGAFTGADRDRKGLFAVANGGTLMLDEVPEMPLKMQVELLRVLQEHRVRPVGAEREEPIDVRVIAATNRPLRELVAEGRFREDLYYRLSVVTLRLPPLRARPDDVPALANHFLARVAEEHGVPRKRLSREAVARLLRAPWPGNVRQLRHVLESAAVLAEGDVIEAEQLELEPAAGAPTVPAFTQGVPPGASPQALRKASERQRILDALEQTNWNKVRAAEVLAMPRRTLYRRLREFGLLD